MPTYLFLCESCTHSFELFQSIKKRLPKKCPKCKAKEPSFHQQYGAGIAVVYNSPTTFGQQAEINAKRLGKEQMQILAEKNGSKQKKGERPFWRDTDKPLNLDTVKDTKKYILTGEKN